MMQYEYCFAYSNNIDACLATEFDACVSFNKAGPVTSASIATAAANDEVCLTLESRTTSKYICKEVQTSGYKCFRKKHVGRHNPPLVIARPIGKDDVALKFVSRNVVKKTWKLLAENKDGKKELLTFGDKDNINDVKVGVRDKFSRGWNDVVHIKEFADVSGLRNALQYFSPGGTTSVQKCQPLKRPSHQKKISKWTKK
jgi:hypothetical protein